MKDFNKIWEILQEAFPPDERRTKEEQERLLKLEAYHITPYYTEQLLVGFLCYWDLGDFIFIEHLAIDINYRGKGFGKEMMKNLLLKEKRMIILEVEYPEDEIKRKRIRFYETLGFLVNEVEYFQPSYGEGKEEVPLLLMSYPKLLSPSGAGEVIRQIYRNVYGHNSTLQ